MGDFMEIWEILGLEPTKDISIIKRAYAQKTKTCHPEENPEGFLELRKAYQAAVSYAEQGGAPLSVFIREQDKIEEAADEEMHSEEIHNEEIHNEETHSEELDDEKLHGEKICDKQEFEEQALDDWTISDNCDETAPNPFRDGEAIQQFMTLYTGKQRKNSKLWLDYFTSAPFLDAAWDSRFTALLLEKVTEVEHDFPLNKELMMWLCIAYQISPNSNVGQEQMFDGIEPILRLVAKGVAPKRAGGDELAVLESFKDYRHLVRMADSGSWNEQAMAEFQWIIDRYTPAYIKERCDANATPDYQRHPAGLRILMHFFQREDLPEELYRIVWQKYGLKNVTMGRMKILYGSLRELVEQRLSGIEEEEVENFLHLNEERAAFFTRIKENPDRAEDETAAFFAKKNVQNALRSRRFMEEQLLSCSNWLNSVTPEIVVCWLQTFYSEHQDILGWERIVERAQQELDYRLEAQNRKAEVENAVPEKPDLSLLLAMPNRVYAQPLTGAERIFQTDNGSKNSMNDEPWEDGWVDENAEPLTEECLAALFDAFAEGALIRLELQFAKITLALVRDGDKYACFCFEENDSTWFSMLSQPEVYQTVDSGDVEYFPFGMGKLASYNIHESSASIMRNLKLVFMQIGRERIKVRVGDCWLWSSHTNRHNGWFKTRMAMQKLAKIPARYGETYILDKFVFSQYPVCAERVSLSGERDFIQIKPGSSDLAVGALMQFFGKKLARLRLSWELKEQNGQNEQNGKACQQHIILLQDSGQFMMAWLRDDNEQAVFYASDAPRIFLGRVYPACLVHQGLGRIRNCLDWILDDMACAELVINRPGEFVAADCPYYQIRSELVDET